MKNIHKLYECFESPTDLDLKRKKLLNMGKPPIYDRSALELNEEYKLTLRQKQSPHWRFLLNHKRVAWNDGILGALSIDSTSISDPVLIRKDEQFLYTLASVVDDIDMEITDVVRGSDHVTNTATQIQITEALNGIPPNYSHHSLLTGPSGENLSKRLGVMSLRDMRSGGIEPMAVLSHLARLGSSQPAELFNSIAELENKFDLATFGSAPTKFDDQDLKLIDEKAKKIIVEFKSKITSSKNLNKDILEPIVNELIKKYETNFKGIGQPLRIALTGSKFGPGLYDIIISLGKEEVEKRLSNKIIA